MALTEQTIVTSISFNTQANEVSVFREHQILRDGIVDIRTPLQREFYGPERKVQLIADVPNHCLDFVAMGW